MPTSPQTSWKSAASLEDAQLSPAILGYFHGVAQDEAHELVLNVFQDMAQSEGINKAFVARRMGARPEQITRMLGAPGNWQLDTITSLLLAMGYKPTFGAVRLTDMRQANDHHPAVGRAPITYSDASIHVQTTATPAPAAHFAFQG